MAGRLRHRYHALLGGFILFGGMSLAGAPANVGLLDPGPSNVLSFVAAARADDDDRGRRGFGGGSRGGFGGLPMGGLGPMGGFGMPPVMGIPQFAVPRIRGQRQDRRRRGGRTAVSTERRVPREFVAAGVDDASATRIRDAGFTIVAQRQLAILPEATLRVRIPRGLSEGQALQILRAIAPAAQIDYNHLYRSAARACRRENCFPFAELTSLFSTSCAPVGTIGMIDTAVDTAHPMLAGRSIEVETIRGPEYRPSSDTHGTEIAMLLLGSGSRAGGAKLIAIDAFHRRGRGQEADVFDVVTAIDRLSARGVSVANLSLSGNANSLLERAGDQASARGLVIVAAAGNEGPTAPPQYPAAYRWAVAVTAVDRRERVYARAVRGPHLAFAAPGVRLQFPDRAMRPGAVRSGTSYATPWVANAIAKRLNGERQAIGKIIEGLARDARDLGLPGRDPVYGWGLIDLGTACQPRRG